MIFPTTVNGIPCQCQVLEFTPYIPATWDDPAEGGEITYQLLDRKGYQAPWLKKMVTPKIDEQLNEEIRVMWMGELLTT